MGIEHGEYDGEPELDSGGVVATGEDAWLILDDELDEDEPLVLNDVDTKPGRLRIHHPPDPTIDDGNITYIDQTYDEFRDARLAFGLWRSTGGFTEPEGSAIPLEVATEGQDAIAAYIYLRGGQPTSRSYVSDQMGISLQTVSNYWNQVRWTPEDGTDG